MPSTQELLNTWSRRFADIGISRTLLADVLRTKPEGVSMSEFYRTCHRNYASGHIIRRPLTLILASNHPGWMQNRLEEMEEETRILRRQIVASQESEEDVLENDENIMPSNIGMQIQR